MDEIVAALAEQQAELGALLDELDEPDWQRASPCDGWTIADIVLHLAQTNELALGSARGRFSEVLESLTAGLGQGRDIDDGAAAMVAREQGGSASAVHERWQTGAVELDRVLKRADPHERVRWVAGELSIHTLTTTRLAETWIHSGDVAEAMEITLAPTYRLRHIARLAWRTLPYAFGRAGRELAGPVAFELASPNGDRWDFVPADPALTVVRGDGVELCRVAARRVLPADTGLRGEGPDAAAVLELVRTYA
ncbi:MAG: maleylpyruvate isomerase family mycothiol-dependent enzyme [Acidimicrobiia bacterium]|nr:maleylpyruvate isomerase family mycothiol-dependent enzyme [Acidimicrobiia bacterium]